MTFTFLLLAIYFYIINSKESEKKLILIQTHIKENCEDIFVKKKYYFK